jgi:hypothetical protein
LQGQVAFGRLPLRPLGQLAFSHAGGSPSLDTGALSLGVGVPIIEGSVELELYAQALAELVHARAESGAGSESELVARGGGSAGLSTYPRLGPFWSAWLGVEATLLTPRVTFEVQNSASGELEALGFRGFLGLRYGR